MKLILAVASLSLLTTACKKDEAKPSTGTGKVADGAGTVAKDQPKATGPFTAWDLEGRKAAFAGAHVAPGDSIGRWEAWDVKGDQVTTWDGTTERKLTLTVQSPCEVRITETTEGGSSSVTHHYTMMDGALVMGLGDAGSRRGGEAVACVSNQVFTLAADGTCQAWELDVLGEEWESEPAKCGFAKDGDQEVFKATIHDHETVLQIHGNALMTAQLALEHSEKVADFAAAKAARDARK